MSHVTKFVICVGMTMISKLRSRSLNYPRKPKKLFRHFITCKKVQLSKGFGHSMERKHKQPERMTRQTNHTLASPKSLKISGNQLSKIGASMRLVPGTERYPLEMSTSSLAVTRTGKKSLNESCCACLKWAKLWAKLNLSVEQRSWRQQLLNASLKYSDTSNLVGMQVLQSKSGNLRKQWASLETSKL